METNDLYAVLGVAPDADDATIKAAYRKLARAYHPDKNPGDAKAEERFKEVNSAYQVLGDPEQRRQYDALRQQARWQGQRHAGGGQATLDPEDFGDLFGAGGPYGDLFGSLFGAGRAAAQGPRRGRDLEIVCEISLEESFNGASRVIQVGERTIEAKIPRGVADGSRVRLAGQGAAGDPAGDLFLVIQLLPHQRFTREGDDLTADVDVDFLTAALGGVARVAGLDGAIKLRIPPRTQAGTRFRLRGKGMPRLGSPDQRGDLYARVRLVLPETLSDADLAALRALRDGTQSAQAN